MRDSGVTLTWRLVTVLSLFAAVGPACGDDDDDASADGDADTDADGDTDGDTDGDGDGDGDADCAADTVSDDPELAAFIEDTKARMTDVGVPGLALAIFEDGQVAHEVVLGVRERGQCGPITHDTLFRGAFYAGMVTGATVLEAGLDLDAPIADLIGGLQFAHGDAAAIRLADVMNNTSGLVWLDDSRCSNPTFEDVVEWLGGTALWADPGWLPAWSGQNGDLAALALARSDGPDGLPRGTYEAAARALVLEPLGMQSVFAVEDLADREHASAHWTNGAIVPDDRMPNCEAAYPYEQTYVSIGDIEKLFEWVMHDGRLLDAVRDNGAEQTTSSMLDSHGLSMIRVPDDDGTELVETASSFRGSSTASIIMPGTGWAFAMITNWDGPGQMQFAVDTELEALRTLAGYEIPPWDHRIPTDRWGEYAGTYVDEIGVDDPPGSHPRTAVVRWNDASEILSVQINDDTTEYPLTAGITWMVAPGIDPDAFMVTYADSSAHPVRFYRDEAGAVDRLYIQWFFGPPFYRVPDAG